MSAVQGGLNVLMGQTSGDVLMTPESSAMVVVTTSSVTMASASILKLNVTTSSSVKTDLMKETGARCLLSQGSFEYLPSNSLDK